jgi:NADH-quinone oxidoreductase subunit C
MADELKPEKPSQAPGPEKPAAAGGDSVVPPEKLNDGSAQDNVAKGAGPQSGQPVTTESQHIAAGKAGDTAQGKKPEEVRAQTPAGSSDAPPKPAAPGTPGEPATTKPPTPPAAKPAAPAGEQPAAPAKPAGPAPVEWKSEMAERFRKMHGSGILESSTYMNQNYLVVDRSIVEEVLLAMRDDEKFDYLVDVTAVHWPQREKQFDVVWILYSFPRNERVRVKAHFGETESAPTVTHIWPTANWLERECYDMFGIRFAGHPDLKRILLPDGWNGHPLRKDYGIIQQDSEWVQINLGIESGQ